MATPFLHTLSLAARQAYPAIVSGVWRGLSANRIQSILQSQGMGIRRQTLLGLVARERAFKNTGRYLEGLRANQRPHPWALPEALTKLTRQYAVTVKVTGTLADSGKETDQFITLSMDKLLPKQEMLDLALQYVEEGPDRYGVVAEGATLHEGVQAGVAGVL